jgi:transcriptional regulator with XRE-family HTH domain
VKNILLISGKALKNARKAITGLTQANVAEAIGIKRETYTNWEAREFIETDRKTVEILKTLLKVSEDVITYVPHETNRKSDTADDPLVKSFVEQIQLQKDMIELLKAEIKRLGGK